MSRVATASLVLALALALTAGCSDSLTPVCAGGRCGSTRSVMNLFYTSANQQLDVLFVIDDTPAMAPYATALSNGLAEMATVLETFVPAPALHVGFVPASACGSPPTEVIRSRSCGQDASFAGTLSAEFARLGTFGFEGCAPAQPLAVIERALTATMPGWEGFLRPDAALALVVISASDDASGPPGSPTAVSRTIDLVRGLKEDPAGQVLISVIGPADCSPDPAPGSLAPRLRQFVESAGGNGLLYAVCNEHFGPALTNLRPLSTEIGAMCLGGVRDVDPITPGLQPECAVFEEMLRRDGSSTTSVLSSCDTSPPPCWSLTERRPYCGAGRVELEIRRESPYCPERTTRTTVECLGCVDPADPACSASRT